MIESRQKEVKKSPKGLVFLVLPVLNWTLDLCNLLHTAIPRNSYKTKETKKNINNFKIKISVASKLADQKLIMRKKKRIGCKLKNLTLSC